MAAANKGGEAAAGVLLDDHADVNATASNGYTALMLAAESGESNIIYNLLKAHAPVDAREKGFGATALMIAASNGKVDAVRSLLTGGADVNAKTTEKVGRTAVDFAQTGHHDDVVNALEATGGHAGSAGP